VNQANQEEFDLSRAIAFLILIVVAKKPVLQCCTAI
jgi:hypothetical protein